MTTSDYTPEQLEEFQEQFRPIAARYRLRSLISAVITVLLAISFAANRLFLHYSWLYFIAGCIFPAVVAIVISPPIPHCPACRQWLAGPFGAFCPSCGAQTLTRGSLLSPAECTTCFRSFPIRKNRNYKICACTHCGVMLDLKGL